MKKLFKKIAKSLDFSRAKRLENVRSARRALHTVLNHIGNTTGDDQRNRANYYTTIKAEYSENGIYFSFAWCAFLCYSPVSVIKGYNAENNGVTYKDITL